MNKDKLIENYIEDTKLNIEEVMKDYTPYIWNIIKNSGNIGNEDVEEIISDVFLALWNNQKKLDFDRKMSSYIFGITKNLIKKKFRDIKFNDNIEDFEEKMISLENIELTQIDKEVNDIIYNEVQKLKTEDKEIFVEYYYYFRRIKEIAIEFNISEAKVKTKLYRIRKKIKKNLIERGYDYDG